MEGDLASLIRVADKFIALAQRSLKEGETIPLKFVIFTRWVNGLGSHTQKLYLTNPGGVRQRFGRDFEFELRDKRRAYQTHTNVTWNLRQGGNYKLGVVLDDAIRASAPLWFGVELKTVASGSTPLATPGS